MLMYIYVYIYIIYIYIYVYIYMHIYIILLYIKSFAFLLKDGSISVRPSTVFVFFHIVPSIPTDSYCFSKIWSFVYQLS